MDSSRWRLPCITTKLRSHPAYSKVCFSKRYRACGRGVRIRAKAPRRGICPSDTLWCQACCSLQVNRRQCSTSEFQVVWWDAFSVLFSIKIHRIHCCYKLDYAELKLFFYEEVVVGWREQTPMRSQKLLGFQPTQHLCLHPLVWEVAHELTVEFQETDLWKGIIFVPDRNLFEKENKKKGSHCSLYYQKASRRSELHTYKSHHYLLPLSRETGKNLKNIWVREETKLFPFWIFIQGDDAIKT